MIFYFSATGNCKRIAEDIAEYLGDRTLPMTEFLRFESYTADISDEKRIGFIMPTYAYGLSLIAEEFFKKMNFAFTDRPYTFLVAAYGTSPGNIAFFTNKYLKKSGMKLDARFSVKTPDTWTPVFDLSDIEKVEKTNRRSVREVKRISSRIKNCEKVRRMKMETPFFTAFIHKPLYRMLNHPEKFTVSESCVGCGICKNNCPVGAIEMKNGKPHWIKTQCAMCLGCLHRCPKFAVSLGKNTSKHGQYLRK